MIQLTILILLFAIFFSLRSLHKLVHTSRIAIRSDYHRENKANERFLTELTEVLERLSIILIYHDATVRGTDPEAIGSTQELLNMLRGKNGKKD